MTDVRFNKVLSTVKLRSFEPSSIENLAQSSFFQSPDILSFVCLLERPRLVRTRLYRNSRSIVPFFWSRDRFNKYLDRIFDLGDLEEISAVKAMDESGEGRHGSFPLLNKWDKDHSFISKINKTGWSCFIQRQMVAKGMNGHIRASIVTNRSKQTQKIASGFAI